MQAACRRGPSSSTGSSARCAAICPPNSSHCAQPRLGQVSPRPLTGRELAAWADPSRPTVLAPSGPYVARLTNHLIRRVFRASSPPVGVGHRSQQAPPATRSC